MLAACEAALPADVAVCAAAVADWRPDTRRQQQDQEEQRRGPADSSADRKSRHPGHALRQRATRPRLVIGFAAETENVVAHATAKRARKGCDWIVANDVSPGTGIMGGDRNRVHLITAAGVEDWPLMDKTEVGRRLAARIAER